MLCMVSTLVPTGINNVPAFRINVMPHTLLYILIKWAHVFALGKFRYILNSRQNIVKKLIPSSSSSIVQTHGKPSVVHSPRVRFLYLLASICFIWPLVMLYAGRLVGSWDGSAVHEVFWNYTTHLWNPSQAIRGKR